MNQRLPAQWLRSLLAGLLFLLITVGLLEGALRLTVDSAALYRGLSLYPQLNRKKFERDFSARYTDKENKLNTDTFDPHLGWDFDIDGDRIRGNEIHRTEKVPGHYRIVTIGDSFTYGTDVEANDSFPASLQKRLCNTEVLNMGVPGYGIDQAVLKYLAHGSAYAPDVVILGIFVDDYERASVPFHAFSKPWLQPTGDGSYRLANQPVPEPQAELDRIRNEQSGEFYSFAFLHNLSMQIRTLIDGKGPAFDRIDGGIAHILKLLQAELRSTGSQLLIVQIPSGDMFTRPNTSWEQAVSKRLKAIYQRLNIHYIDLSSAFRSYHSAEQIVNNYYVHLGNGTTGHLNANGNAVAAQQMIAALRSIDSRLLPEDCVAPAKPPNRASQTR